MLPMMEHTLVFENEFMLTDNFGLPQQMDEVSYFVAPLYPFKIDFTLMLFCTAGTMSLHINLQECRLEAGQVLVVLPGTVGECLEVSIDCQVAMIAYVGRKYEEGIDAATSMQFTKYLVRQSVLSVLPEEMDESLTIYRAMRRKVEQPDFEFTREVMTNALDNATIEQTEANTQQIRANTLLNVAQALDSETILRGLCDVLDVDYEDVKGRVDSEAETDEQRAMNDLMTAPVEEEAGEVDTEEVSELE